MSEDNVVPITAAKKDGTVELNEAQKAAKRQFWTDVLWKLTESQRFLDFVDANFNIGMGVDEETKTILCNVIEKPVADPAKFHIDGGQVMKMHGLLLQAGVRDASALLKSLLGVISGEAPSIHLATDADMTAAIQQADLKSKLDV